MKHSQNQIIEKILNAIDSDDVHATALFVESNVSKEDTNKLENTLKILLQENKLNIEDICSINQFLYFLG